MCLYCDHGPCSLCSHHLYCRDFEEQGPVENIVSQTHTNTQSSLYAPCHATSIQSRPQSVKPINSEVCVTKTPKYAIHHSTSLFYSPHTKNTQMHTSAGAIPYSWVKAISLDHPADCMTMQPVTETKSSRDRSTLSLFETHTYTVCGNIHTCILRNKDTNTLMNKSKPTLELHFKTCTNVAVIKHTCNTLYISMNKLTHTCS